MAHSSGMAAAAAPNSSAAANSSAASVEKHVDVWVPSQYSLFDSYRLRPAEDLLHYTLRTLSQIHSSTPAPSVPVSSTLTPHFASLTCTFPWFTTAFPSVHTVADLGCGAGVSLRGLLRVFPSAEITAVDGSANMLEAARKRMDTEKWSEEEKKKVKLIEDDLFKFCEERKAAIAAHKAKPFDVIYSNATFMWLPNHHIVFPMLVELLTPGTGLLAIQMSNNFGSPSHLEIRESLKEGGWIHPDDMLQPVEGNGDAFDRASSFVKSTTTISSSSSFLAGSRPSSSAVRSAYISGPRAGSVWSSSQYFRLLRSSNCPPLSFLDMFETEYSHVLPTQPSPSSPLEKRIFHPVCEWVKGTALSPVLTAMKDDNERIEFQNLYSKRLMKHYPLVQYDAKRPFVAPDQSNIVAVDKLAENLCTVFPFKRFFLLAVRALPKV